MPKISAYILKVLRLAGRIFRRKTMLLRLLIVAALLVLAAGLILFARNISSLNSGFQNRDVQFLMGEVLNENSWARPKGFLYKTSDSVLGLKDDRDLRGALVFFVRSQLNPYTAYSFEDSFKYRILARLWLSRILDKNKDVLRASYVHNLLGVLDVDDAVYAIKNQQQKKAAAMVAQAIDDFNSAIALSGDNVEAKRNLELLLTLIHSDKKPQSQKASGKGKKKPQKKHGARPGVSPSGTGY